jgi:hypothetical protein
MRKPLRMFGPALVTNSLATLFTVPTAEIYVVRHMHVQNNSGAAATLTISIGADAAGTRIYDTYSIPALAAGVVGSAIDIWCFYPLVAAEIMRAVSGTTNVLTLTVSGDEIILG